MRILLLGGTAEARALAERLAEAGYDAIYSIAGRTARPLRQPLALRVGGFGGVEGLSRFLTEQAITHLIDATHPFAANMSRNAVEAARRSGVALAALERPAWHPGPEEDWREVGDIAGAVAALPETGARVFLAIGRQHVATFASKPGNFYLLRFVDPPEGSLPLPDAEVVVGRGPFTEAGDRTLMEGHAITHLVAKNSGSDAARAKIDAARALGVKIVMIARPPVPERRVFRDAEGVMGWLQSHRARLGV